MKAIIEQLSQDNCLKRSATVTKLQIDSGIPPLENWLSDVALLRDKQAFSGLFNFFAPKISGVARQKLNNDSQAKDIVQQTLTQVWHKAHLYDADKGAVTSWVYRIMRNAIFDTLRKSRHHSEQNLSQDLWPIDNVADQPLDFADHLEVRHLGGLIKQLPQPQKQAVEAVYYQQLTQQQLAEQLNVPLGTIKSRLRLALLRLKQQIGEQHD